MQDHKYESFAAMIEGCRGLPPLPTAVAYPCDEIASSGAMRAGTEGIIKPILVGPKAEILGLAASLRIDLSRTEVQDSPDCRAAAQSAVGLAASGRARALMKGNLETADLMSAVVHKDSGLHTRGG